MNKKLLGGIIIVLILVGAFFAFGKKAEPTVTAPQTIKLGLMFPLTSQFGSVAEGVKNASLLAVSDWQAAHPNVKVEVVTEDDAYDPKKGIAIYNKFKNIDKVEGIVSISTPVVDALYKTYQADGIPVINLGVQTEGVANDNIFQIFPDAKGQVKPLADYLMSRTNYDSVVIVHTTNDAAYAQFYNEFIKIYTKQAYAVVLNGKEDSKLVASKIVATKSKAVIFILAPSLGSVVVKDLQVVQKDKMDYYFDGSLITGMDEYKKMLGDTNILNGATTIKYKASDMAAFKAAYKAKYGTDPTIFAETGYDSVMVMLNSYDTNKTTWVNNIEKSSYTGPSGKTTFDQNGVRVPEYEMAKVVNGEVK